MEKEFYLQYASVEDEHWWFVARRQILEKVISRLNLPNNAQILEAGCGILVVTYKCYLVTVKFRQWN